MKIFPAEEKNCYLTVNSWQSKHKLLVPKKLVQQKQLLVYIVTWYLQPLNGKNTLKYSLYCLRIEPSDTDSNQTPPTWPLLCLLFWARRTLCACVRYSHLLPHSHEDFATQKYRDMFGDWMAEQHWHAGWISLYLEGATPTRFGPRPRKSDRGPSFSKIDLKQKQI